MHGLRAPAEADSIALAWVCWTTRSASIWTSSAAVAPIPRRSLARSTRPSAPFAASRRRPRPRKASRTAKRRASPRLRPPKRRPNRTPSTHSVDEPHQPDDATHVLAPEDRHEPPHGDPLREQHSSQSSTNEELGGAAAPDEPENADRAGRRG